MDMEDTRNEQSTGNGQTGEQGPSIPHINSGGYENRENYGGYYTGYAPQAQQKPAKKSGAGIKVLIALLMVVCLAAGGVFTAYVIMPNNNNTTQTAVNTQDQNNEQQSLTTDAPQIGGEAPDINSTESPYVQIAKAVMPSIVIVRIDDPQTDDESDPQGSGIIISDNGYIMTNEHVVADSEGMDIVVTTDDGTNYKAEVVGTDITSDLAVIKIEATGLKAAALGDSDSLQVGEEVVAIGNALGMGENTVTSGIISGLDREVESSTYYKQAYIQTDAAINPGNSGGALVNMRGEVIGINTLKSFIAEYQYGQALNAEGMGYAIPINTAKPVVEQIMETGKVPRAGIGIMCVDDTYNEYNPQGSPEGATVTQITQGGPAEKAGLELGDIITSADGTAVKDTHDLVVAVHAHQIGETMNIVYWRDGKSYDAMIIIGDIS